VYGRKKNLKVLSSEMDPADPLPDPNANSCKGWREIFKWLSQDGGRADFSKNLRASLFNKALSNEPLFRPDPSRWTVPLNEIFCRKM
jgi:hypothetical protein